MIIDFEKYLLAKRPGNVWGFVNAQGFRESYSFSDGALAL